MSNGDQALNITLPANAENVAVVRHALAGLAETLGMDEPGIADLKTVVTEACMNVVVHAYAGRAPGPLEVEAQPGARRPHGRRPRLRARDPPPPRRRAAEPAHRPDPDRRPLQQLRDQGRRRPRHRDPMHLPLQAARSRSPTDEPGGAATAEATELTVGPPRSGRAGARPGPRRARRPPRHHRRPPLRRDAAQRRDLRRARPQGFERRPRLARASPTRDEGIELRVGPMKSGGAERLRASARAARGRRLSGDAGRRAAGRAERRAASTSSSASPSRR